MTVRGVMTSVRPVVGMTSSFASVVTDLGTFSMKDALAALKNEETASSWATPSMIVMMAITTTMTAETRTDCLRQALPESTGHLWDPQPESKSVVMAARSTMPVMTAAQLLAMAETTTVQSRQDTSVQGVIVTQLMSAGRSEVTAWT